MKERFLPLWLRYKDTLVPIVTIGISVFILFLIVIPQFLSYLSDQTQLKDFQSKALSLEVKAAALEKLNEAENQRSLQSVTTYLPSDPDVPAAISILQNAVNKSGLKLVKVSYISKKGVLNANNFQLNLEIEGSLSQIRNLLISMKSSGRLYEVESIEVTRVDKAIQATIPINVFYGQKSAKASSQKDLPELSETDKKLLSNLETYLINSTNQGNSSSNYSQIPLGKSDPFQ